MRRIKPILIALQCPTLSKNEQQEVINAFGLIEDFVIDEQEGKSQPPQPEIAGKASRWGSWKPDV